MTEADMILKQFHPNEPILVEDIIKMFPDHSRYWIDNTLKAMLASRRLSRFATGVYYIPKYDIFVDNSISVDKVVTKKYIKHDDDVYGYFSGMTLLYEIGIIEKKPQTIAVVSNKEKSRGRTITIHNQDIYISKSPVHVTRVNHIVLQFLVALKITIKGDDETAFAIIYEYARAKDLHQRRQQILRLLSRRGIKEDPERKAFETADI